LKQSTISNIMRFANALEGNYPAKEYGVDPHNFSEDDLAKLIFLISKNAR